MLYHSVIIIAYALTAVDNILGRLAGKDGNMDSFASEMQILRKLLKQLSTDEKPEPKEEEEFVLSADAEVQEETTTASSSSDESPESTMPRDVEILEIVRAGLQENKVDLYLQPIVRLPQRRTLFYEAFSRIRGPRGEDNLLLIRCVQLIRRVRQKNSEIGFFVNVSARTLRDTAFFRQFVDFLDQNKDLSDSLILEFAQIDIDNASEAIQKGLSTLAKMGFHFSVDHVERLDFDFGELGKRNFRYMKVAAVDLLPGGTGLPMDIHPDDLREALYRENIELIASMVEDEDTVIGLLDVEVGFGQGFLFGVPRPPQAVN